MFGRGEEPRFTIEQIDLLQRLRRTGISQAELLHALDALEHLERSRRPRPRPAPLPSSVTSAATQTAFPEKSLLLSPPRPVSITQSALVASGKLSPLAVVGFETSEEDLDVDEKVEDLMRRDSSVIKEEIKSFLAARRISQAVVAQVTGISQSRISHWLLQQGSDLSEQKKRAFFRWYQLEKSNPGVTLAMRTAPLALEEVVDWHQPSFTPAPGGFRLRRGSRFTWRKECLAVMESYFNDNSYPDEVRREEIAAACNAVIQKPGKKLSDMERVTSLKVYNWFANRRKDLKRRANIAAILESHGVVDVQSPGAQSNSDEVDGGDFPEQGCDVFDKRVSSRGFGFGRADLSSPTQVPTLIPSWFSALGRGHRGRSLLSGAQAEGSKLPGASWSPTSLPDEPMTHGTLPQDPSGQQKVPAPHEVSGLSAAIKTEVLEDD
ncbi:homeobox-containing protein 1-like isoform X2 [Synchiropus splendidus]|uniref:homeobox-containing protein 1-like isoform X2 n=1 Tax=Synchiropus splendidus TaxID=270530 RepID=UPI00237DA3CB|nr:homeobox-containing protein 1-like isoform X2 [Synchiropus splendidus]